MIPVIILKKTQQELEQENRQQQKRNQITEIRKLLDSKLYSERAAALALGISRKTVRRVREGDIELLCQSSGNRHSRLDSYASVISEWLTQGKKFTEIKVLLQQFYGVTMGNTQVSFYCSEIKKSLGLYIHNPKPDRFVSRQDVFHHIWSGQDLAEKDWIAICEKYPRLQQLDSIIKEFRYALNVRDAEQLSRWIEQYGNGHFSHINSFIKGLKRDWIAVKNGFTYSYNSGFVEGTVNKLKTTKRMMYGRAGYALLRAKMLAPYYQRKPANVLEY